MGSIIDIEPDDIRHLPTFRAAYADRTALLMAKLSKRVYSPFNDEVTYKDFRTTFMPLGLEVKGRLIDEPKGTSGVILANDDLIVIVFRGTENLLDWLTNLRAGWYPLQGGVKVHKGFFEAYQPVRTSLFAELLVLIHAKKRPVYITGHSLGGALALMAAAELGNHDEAEVRDSIAACYTFGCPKAGDRMFDRFVKVPLYRITNGVDIVPALPPVFSGYRHVGDTRYFGQIGSASVRRAPSYLKSLRFTVWGLFLFFARRPLRRVFGATTLQNIADHKMEIYIEKLDAWIRSETQAAQMRRQKTADPSLQ